MGLATWQFHSPKKKKKPGWWFQKTCFNHLEKWWTSSMGRMTSHIWNGKKHVPNHQPVTLFQTVTSEWSETAIFCEDSGCSDLNPPETYTFPASNQRCRHGNRALLREAKACAACAARAFCCEVCHLWCGSVHLRDVRPLSAIFGALSAVNKRRFQRLMMWNPVDFCLLDIIPQTASRRIFRMDVESTGGYRAVWPFLGLKWQFFWGGRG